MKKITLFVLFVFVLSMAVAAHPPKEIILKFNNLTKTLTADVIQGSKDRKKHYIDRVKVGLNGEEIIVHKVKAQRIGVQQIFVYSIPDAKLGDKIKLNANCNKFGNKTETIIVRPGKKVEKKKSK